MSGPAYHPAVAVGVQGPRAAPHGRLTPPCICSAGHCPHTQRGWGCCTCAPSGHPEAGVRPSGVHPRRTFAGVAASRLAPRSCLLLAQGSWHPRLAICLPREAVNIYRPRYSPGPEKGMGGGRQGLLGARPGRGRKTRKQWLEGLRRPRAEPRLSPGQSLRPARLGVLTLGSLPLDPGGRAPVHARRAVRAVIRR